MMKRRSVDMTDAETFAKHCVAFYFTTSIPPQESTAYITSALSALPPAQHAVFARIQASIRSLAHIYHFQIRKALFNKLIHETSTSDFQPTFSGTPSQNVFNVTERRARLSMFISTWCSKEKSELFPFFRGLYGVLYIQSQCSRMGVDDGEHRVVWEIDDAVFQESGGSEFMYDAILILKNVLKFDIHTTHNDIEDQDIYRPIIIQWLPRITRPSQPLAPFSNLPDVTDQGVVSHPMNSLCNHSSPSTGNQLLFEDPHAPEMIKSNCQHVFIDSAGIYTSNDGELAVLETKLNKHCFRSCEFPSAIGNEEILDLMSLFPRVISQKPKPHFVQLDSEAIVDQQYHGHTPSISYQAASQKDGRDLGGLGSNFGGAGYLD
ncbi:hypothetical protein I312_106424 [Cryptococcus bacillisporus CA1280]|uniref:uncharacterized protein n=1 Tax=Cryptococcus bacillisporus CA1280 TaxID=1296109 RepID=UPI0033661CAB